MSGQQRPVTVMIAAMGGEGGGVFTSWLVNAARGQGLAVQATSTPGVAQRTGATVYYVEIMPKPDGESGDESGGESGGQSGGKPVMDIFPGHGNIDLLLATELVETGRMLERGFVSPERTTLIASTHRIFTLGEKMAMGDGRIDGERVLGAARELAKTAILFDVERAAKECGSHLNAVMLGAAAGSGVLPIAPEVFEEGIRAEGKAVEQNLAGFAAGLAYARGEIVEAPAGPGSAAAQATAPVPDPVARSKAEQAAADLRGRIELDYPQAVHDIVIEAAGRALDFQDRRYAELYLDRLRDVLALDQRRGDDDYRLTRETARHLGLRMTFEDIIRVAQLKTRGSRLERVRSEAGAEPGQIVTTTEFLKPGIEEFSSLLPAFVARPIMAWAERNPGKARKAHIAMHVRTNTILGFLRLRSVAWLRPLRRLGYRYEIEQAQIENWLDLVCGAAAIDHALALEIVECARLIKGYGDTHRRGTENFARIAEAIVAPALTEGGRPGAAEAVRRAREAALADPEGEALTSMLATLAAEADAPERMAGE